MFQTFTRKGLFDSIRDCVSDPTHLSFFVVQSPNFSTLTPFLLFSDLLQPSAAASHLSASFSLTSNSCCRISNSAFRKVISSSLVPPPGFTPPLHQLVGVSKCSAYIMYNNVCRFIIYYYWFIIIYFRELHRVGGWNLPLIQLLMNLPMFLLKNQVCAA